MLQKEQLGLCPEDFVLPVSFLLSMSLLGLEFPFAYILVFIVLYLSLIVNKYDFLLQSTILFGVFGFYDENVTFPIKMHDLLFIVYIAGFFIFSFLCWFSEIMISKSISSSKSCSFMC